MHDTEYIQIRLCYDVTTLWGDHHPLGYITSWVLNGFQHASRNTRCPLNSRTVVKFAVVIRWAILNPMTLS